jgi:hypothetical protein
VDRDSGRTRISPDASLLLNVQSYKVCRAVTLAFSAPLGASVSNASMGLVSRAVPRRNEGGQVVPSRTSSWSDAGRPESVKTPTIPHSRGRIVAGSGEWDCHKRPAWSLVVTKRG